MEVKVVKGNLVITIPMNKQPFQPSKSGKTSMVCSSGGNMVTDAEVKGKDGGTYNVVVGLNAFIKDQG